MSVVTTVNGITGQIVSYTPALVQSVRAAVEVAESVPEVTGPQKQRAVVAAVLEGVEVGSQALETHSNPTVAAVALLVNLVVSVLNSLGVFKRKAATS